eukprot:TRINITY_DN460_c3_g1_i1.p1 TRINITY_DN460_c3_g1~~TRINITY_DN460_c3_g1_i1.p1  ORF type:complete len:465 (+),score=96.34 TRINITY_DN460_c3_g1_i1:62-1456(+)
MDPTVVEAMLVDMFPGVAREEVKKVLEREGFDNSVNHFLALEATGQQEEPEAAEAAPVQPAVIDDETIAMHNQLDAERQRQNESRSVLADIFTKTSSLLTEAARTITRKAPTTSPTPELRDIEATSEGGLVVPPTVQPTAASAALPPSPQNKHLDETLENTKYVLESTASPTGEIENYKKLLDEIPPSSTVVAVIGAPNTGKTSVINAMLGTPLLPTKPPGLRYTVQNQPEGATCYLVEDVIVDLSGLPVFQVKKRMEEVMQRVTEDGTQNIEVKGPGLFPDDMEIREVDAGTDVPRNWVGVVIVNNLTADDLKKYKDQPNVVLISVKEEAEDGVLVVDATSYLSSIILQNHGAGGPYMGSFNILREKVNSIRAGLKAAREDTTAGLLNEIGLTAQAHIDKLQELQHACGFDSDLSRPPLSSERPVVSSGVEYMPVQPVHQPQSQYIPVESTYVPVTSTWQPKA